MDQSEKDINACQHEARAIALKAYFVGNHHNACPIYFYEDVEVNCRTCKYYNSELGSNPGVTYAP